MSVRVVARIRPLLRHELDKDTIVTAESTTDEITKDRPTIVRLPNPKTDSESFSFQFSSVYEQEATQQELFDSEISPTVKHLFNGFDLSIFAHGCTGTGKTHTMRGGKTLAERGVIPRLLSAIYRRCKKVEKDTGGATQVQVALEYFEIYCDRVYDLFEPPEKRTPSGLPIRDSSKGKTVVVGLTEKPCATLKEFEQLYDQANVNRSTSATKITQTTEDTIRVSRASCIDLAGSEDNRRTDNNKERLVESSAINKSLFVLAQCVDAINKKQARIPYRESKMTRILSLGQKSGLTVMILNLAPTRAYHLDTLASLNFASRTKKIEVSEVENDPIYRAMTKPLAATSSIGGATIARQPLRPLAAAHNANIQEVEKKMQGQKPNKAFSVYSDSRKPSMRGSNLPNQNQTVRRSDTHKRAAESSASTCRPTKTYRSTDSVSRARGFESTMTKESIEAMISQRIDEKLAEKALQDAAVSAPALSAELQRRLDDLEQRVEARDDDKSGPGLQFLLMGKQHLTRGEEVSALRMFQLALPYFPGNSRLETKIAKLEESIRCRQKIGTAMTYAAPQASSRLANLPLKQRKLASGDETDDEFAPPDASDHDESYASDSSVKFEKAARKTKPMTKKLPIFRDRDGASDCTNPEDQTPRTTRLLKIINTKDIAQIKALKGVGAKKADAIVNCLVDMDDEEVRDLQMLAMLKGVGGKSVETMRLGLTVEF
ncbi:hypothetical protein SLS60_009701 [Paraconiothyrium brasiliense]|uniref:Kinesin motor domain-containing protein n=1 Tax=Paraconiothyrium brasiliense TaxID=300254 RepID=A0ABR3QTA8_9PLEO